MTLTDPNTLGAVPFYKSPVQIAQVTTFVSALIAMFPKWGAVVGLTTPDQVNTAVETTFGFIALVAPFVGMILRAKSKIQPLTITPTGAANHPATAVAAARNNDES